MAKKLTYLIYSKIDCLNKGEDTFLVDEKITELLESDIGKSLDANEIFKARKEATEKYKLLEKVPVDDEVFRASLETKTGKKM